MDILNAGGYSLFNCNKLNFIMGKNGSGKSRAMRAVEKHISGQTTIYGLVRYITPERGGGLTYNAGEENSINTNPIDHLRGTRRSNRQDRFRIQSVAQFRRLERLTFIEMEEVVVNRAIPIFTFNDTVMRINSLLDNVVLKRDNNIGFTTYSKSDSELQIPTEQLSSGESELISLATECLVFEKEIKKGKPNILLFDEPDVHLHPDLQHKFAKFLLTLTEDKDIYIIIATHSTPFLASISSSPFVNLAFIKNGDQNIKFKSIASIKKNILPIFGAHPLSEVFNDSPIFLVEGESEERIWQWAIRKSNRVINVWPINTNGRADMPIYERLAKEILQSIYDNAKGYSLRDGDGITEEIDDDLPIIRFRLKCYSSENLCLTDEALSNIGVTWENSVVLINSWITTNAAHPHYNDMVNFRDNGFDRKNHKIKTIINDLLSILGSRNDWEIIVGSTIAKFEYINSESETSIKNFLGDKIIENLLAN